jgi:hypothetical protein
MVVRVFHSYPHFGHLIGRGSVFSTIQYSIIYYSIYTYLIPLSLSLSLSLSLKKESF